MAIRKTKEFRVLNKLTELDALAGGLRDFCVGGGMTDEEALDVRLAVEEAVSNTIRHGYGDRQVHQIRVRAALVKGELRLEIVDDGRAFNPLEAPLPDLSLPAEKRPVGGLGILLLKSVMDRLEYRRRAGKNILRLVRSLRRDGR
jgi:anti-sigma regulatory factor (Ser/Thr protein kinase)